MQNKFSAKIANGFTLAELAISTGLTMMIALTISTVTSFLMKEVVGESSNIGIATEAKMANLRLQRIVSSAGGGLIKPFLSIRVSNNVTGAAMGLPDPQQTDWIHTLRLQSDVTGTELLQSLSLGSLGYDGATGEIDIDNFFGCPLLDSYLGLTSALVYKQALRVVVITGFDNATCKLQSVPSIQGALLSNWTAEKFLGGALIPVIVSTTFLDPSTHEIKKFEDANNDGVAQPDEIQWIIQAAYDLQVAMGYDVKVLDGNIEDTGDQNDEWLYNSPLDAIGVGGLASFKFQRLRMIEIAVLIAHKEQMPTGKKPMPIASLDGPPVNVDGLAHSVSIQKLYLRNASLFIR